MTIKTFFRWIAYFFAFIVALILISALVIRFFIFPNINDYKSTIAEYAGKNLERKVSIGKISTGWHHLSPRVSLIDVNIFDKENRSALLLKEVDTELSWLSIGLFDIRLSELTAHQPNLVIRRNKENRFFIAGIDISGHGNPKFANWLISQSKVSITDAQITYVDELRQAPPLSLTKLNFTLSNNAWRSLLGRHQIAFEAIPSIGTHEKIVLDGHFVGNDIAKSHLWYGELHTKVNNTNLAVWKPWVDYPVDIEQGIGKVDANLTFAKEKIEKLQTSLALKNLVISDRSSINSKVNIKQLDGDLTVQQNTNQWSLISKNLNLVTDTGLEINQATGFYLQTVKEKSSISQADLSIQHVSLSALKKTATLFKLPQIWLDYLNNLNPTGDLTNLTLKAAGPTQAPDTFSIESAFENISINSYKQIPGIQNVSGDILADENSGEINLSAKNSQLNLLSILRWPVPLNALKANVSWENIGKNTQINLKNGFVENPHLSGTVNGSYTINSNASDEINLTGDFTRADASNAKFYYPASIGGDALDWLDKSILKGNLSDIKLTIKGKTDDFPFVDKSNRPDKSKGTLLVTANLSNASVKITDEWPVAENINSTLKFESNSMELIVSKAQMLGQKITSATITVPALDADNPILNATGVAEAPLTEGINFINKSPVKEFTDGFTQNLKTAGNGHLDIQLSVPLNHSIDTNVKGDYRISNGTLFKNEDIGIPELTLINGTLSFDNHGIYAHQIRTIVAGGPAQIDINSQSDKTVVIKAKGHASDAGLKKLLDLDILKPLEGSANWDGSIVIKKPTVNITIHSDLNGMAFNAPSPLNKVANTASKFLFKKIQTLEGADTLEITLDEFFKTKLARIETHNNFDIKHGVIAINKPADLPVDTGIYLNADLKQANLELWLDFINKNQFQNNEDGGIKVANLTIEELNVFDRMMHKVAIVAHPSKTGMQLAFNGPEIVGNAQWISADNGKIIAKLNTLKIPKSNFNGTTQKTEARRLAQEYPALDILVDNFELGDKKLGGLELNAFENDESWIIQKLNITNPDSNFVAEGTWHNWTRNPNTYLKFTLQANNIGKTLVRFGQPDTVKGGKATLAGVLQWPGSPHQFEASSINGEISLDAEKGQILKIKPGVARLLGLISLQSLPRRLTLDFRDLFSEGFAFDNINATAIATNGVLRSNNFVMDGPAAEVKIKGETNIKAETQDLKVKVIPHISDSLSLAALAGGPIVGAAAFVAQKILRDPLNKIVSTEYNIVGTWSNPQEIQSNKDVSKESVPSPLQQK
jgi:uncharacterized protein (TIGR02099 family)